MPRLLSSRERTTPRLILRPFRRRDLEPLLAAVHDSLDDLSRWLPWAHARYGRSEALRFLRDSAAAWADGRAHDFAIRSVEDEATHLGNVSVWHTSRREQAGEVGYWVRSSRTGEGIATEAAARIMQVAFEELRLHRVILRVAVGNRASERIAEKLHFVQEGVLRKEVLIAGEWMDHSLWSQLAEEYRVNREQYLQAGWLAR